MADGVSSPGRRVSPARFPAVARGAGHYESVFLKACHPQGGLAVWIRYTVHKRPGKEPKGFVWFTLFDAARGVAAAKAQTAAPTADAAGLIALGDNVFTGGRVIGAALDAAWDLRFSGSEPPLWHLGHPLLYRAPVPRTKVLSPYPAARFSGCVRWGERTVDLDDWPGTVGHNWGTEHAHRAIWIHGANFAEHRDAWLDLAIGRIKLGGLVTPWVANGALSLDGRRHRLGGVGRRVRIGGSHERCEFELTGEGITIAGEVGAPREHFVGWVYAQPSGQERQTINCSIANLRLDVTRHGSPPLALAVAQGGAYELQMEERYPEIAVQPFPGG